MKGLAKIRIKPIKIEDENSMTLDFTPNWSAMPVLEMLPFTGQEPLKAEAKFAKL